MTPTGIKSRFIVLALLGIALFSVLLLGGHRAPPGHLSPIQQAKLAHSGGSDRMSNEVVLTGHAIAPKLGNATAKYVLSKHHSGDRDKQYSRTDK